MREIKFRAKAIEDFETHIEGIEIGDWVYGFYYFDRSNMCGIMVTDLQEESGGVEGCSGIMQCHIKVDYKTVGQYMGRRDKNDKEIYEGDILKLTCTDEDSCMGRTFEEIYLVYWNERNYCFSIKDNKYHVLGDHSGNWKMDFLNLSFIEEVEILGNQYENPELLKGE